MVKEWPRILLAILFLAFIFPIPIAMSRSNNPVANDQYFQIHPGDTIEITLTGIDLKNSKLDFQIVTTPSHGKLMGEVPRINYTSDKNYNGNDHFTFLVKNSNNESSEPAVIFVTITPIEHFPLEKYYIATVGLVCIFAAAFSLLLYYNHRSLREFDTTYWIKLSSRDETIDEYIIKVAQNIPKSFSNTHEILSKEYDRYSELLKDYRTLGEKRISFFMTLITTVIGALGVATIIGNQSPLVKVEQNSIFLFVVSFILLGLFLFGLFTFRRIINGNVITDDHKVNLDRIRLMLNFQPIEYVKSRRETPLLQVFSLQRAGYAQLVKLLNSLIIGLICVVVWIYLFGHLNFIILIPFIVGVLGSWLSLSLYGNISTISDERHRIRVVI